ncbi:hypothetical protein NUU61_002456 [Penicillium alfredii]|uniref:DNA-directed RNA polymerase III subunit RPC3 n=1 Tax=Penicillium alfredii TaxID=1506179 RepID=A0A9W9FRR3_9EURO|nr:uncharacterized protein NUU61_002456 [Penicillium alfredii]KAJ5105109.1 hypothetical protein NUU61_002456 [Penicillium alfredii]
MMSQNAAELCALLIEDNFGELFARIFSTLQRYERLSLPRLKFHSHLTDRQLHHGLCAMIQHHLVYHFTSVEDGITYYEANPQAAYYLVRSGKILQLIENRLGPYAAQVMEAILYLGHSSVSHLDILPELQSQRQQVPNGFAHDEESRTNGDGPDHLDGPNGDHVDEKPARLHPTIKALASHGYIIRVREAHFQSPDDNWLDAHRIVAARPHIKTMKGKAQQAALLEKTLELVQERTNGDLTERFMIGGLPRGVKRKFGHGASDTVNHNGVNEDHMVDEENEWSDDEDGFDTVPLEPGLVVRVNYEKLDVALRNARFIELAEQDSSSVTAEIYDCLLRRIEAKTKHCRDTPEIPREGEEGEIYSVPIHLEVLTEDVDPQLDLAGSIGPLEPFQPVNRRGKRPLENGVNGDDDAADTDESAGTSRAYKINQHLSLLAQPPYRFTSSSVVHGEITWRVAFRHLARKLRHQELEQMIEARFGDVALRIVRVLQAKGKLDEKRLQEISMLPFKDLRQTLASMQAGGFVDLQEVPRDAQRQPSKTIYLWYYDPDRICSSILEDTYKAMSRCLQRINFERERERDFLEKTERSDVKGNEERYLSEGELEKLQRWKAREALLLGVVARLDDMVAVFRDY